VGLILLLAQLLVLLLLWRRLLWRRLLWRRLLWRRLLSLPPWLVLVLAGAHLEVAWVSTQPLGVCRDL
jgi:multisubunit Na+/H+ antiporter MnhE subunit